jgi:hypothetical protein
MVVKPLIPPARPHHSNTTLLLLVEDCPLASRENCSIIHMSDVAQRYRIYGVLVDIEGTIVCTKPMADLICGEVQVNC